MAIDLSLTKDELLADAAKRYKADTERSINWKPTFSRVKIKPDPEALSAIIAVDTRDPIVRGTIVEIGPDCGYREGNQIEKFYPGQKVLYMKSHVMTYKGADGVVHHFLKENSDVNSIIAIEDAPVESVSAETIQRLGDARGTHATQVMSLANKDKSE